MYIISFLKSLYHKHVEILVLRYRFRNKLWTYNSCIIGKNSQFEGCNKVGEHAQFSGKMGYGSYIGKYSAFHGTVGRFSSISRYVTSNNGMHPSTNPYATTCPMFYSTSKQNGHTFANKQLFNEFKPEPTIGNDCWIGQNVFIAGGVSIGDGAIIYAGAVVTKDIPPYAIAAGVPASVIKYRYDEETIEFLLKLKWWDLPVEWLKDNWALLCNIEELKKQFSKLS